MNIGDTIKKLRVNKDITQEKLADYLNISCQAISKWERNECYPDITMLIPIANYFGITVDDLLGYDSAKNELRIQDFLEKQQALRNQGQTAEFQDLIRRTYSEFPNDFRVMDLYVWTLMYDLNSQNGYKQHKDEIIKLSNRILEECFDEEIRYRAIFNLVCVYAENGDKAKALSTCDRFPEGIYTRSSMKKEVFKRGDKDRLTYIREQIWLLAYSLSIELRDIGLEDSDLSIDKQILAFEKGISFMNIIFDEKDYGFQNYLLSNLYRLIGNLFLQKGDLENSIKQYNQALGNATIYDGLAEHTVVYTSLFLKNYQFNMNEVSTDIKGSFRHMQLIEIKDFVFKSDFKDNEKIIELLSSSPAQPVLIAN